MSKSKIKALENIIKDKGISESVRNNAEKQLKELKEKSEKGKMKRGRPKKVKYIVVFQDERPNKRPEAYNKTRAQWDSYPEDLKNAFAYHFDSEKEVKSVMDKIGVVNYYIKSVFMKEDTDKKLKEKKATRKRNPETKKIESKPLENEFIYPYKKEIEIGRDSYNFPVRLKIEIKKENKEGKKTIDLKNIKEYAVLSISGGAWNGRRRDYEYAGQIYDTIRQQLSKYKKLNLPKSEIYKILDTWEKWNLNDMRMGTNKQNKAIQEWEDKGNEFNYGKAVEHLKSIDLYEDMGYKYGHSWLLEELPYDVEKEIRSWKNDELKNKNITRKRPASK